ncbi:putative neural-cadherin 2 [Macrobrachium rosenbergii]|uniref:putative neural-cadherin 2 n=1 Tax=Macrobrachium rosenbergii TaxID=79674 RepID=UPI0034D6A58B
MDPGKIFQIITNSTLLATRLLSGSGSVPLEFTQPHYCAVLREDAQLAAAVLNVTAIHKEGAAVRYSITGGNRDGLFTIDQSTGLITLAATLDYEVYDKHELVISGEAEGQTAHTIVQVRVADVNDNPPYFVKPDPEVTVIEEDDRHLPVKLLKVEARDKDDLDYQGLLYTVRGDGVDGYKPGEAYFTVNSLTGELIQQRALDRDPPWGKPVWKVRVQVRDGQALWSRPRDKRRALILQEESSAAALASRDSLKRSQQQENTKRKKRRGGQDKDVAKEREKKMKKKKKKEREMGVKIRGRKMANSVKAHSKKKWLLSSRRQKLNSKSNSFYRQKYRYVPSGTAIALPDGHYDKGRSSVYSDKASSDLTADGYVRSSEVLEGVQLHKPPRDGQRVAQTINVNAASDKRSEGAEPFSLAELQQFPDEWRTRSTQDNRIDHNEHHLMPGRILNNLTTKHKLDSASSKDVQIFPNPSKVVDKSERDKRKESSELLPVKGSPVSKVNEKLSEVSPVFPVTYKREKRTNLDEGAMSHSYEFGSFGIDGGCDNDSPFISKGKNTSGANPSDPWANKDLSAYGIGGKLGRIHVAETTVTLYVKDINDNPPVFPNATMFGEVQENGPIDLSVAVVSAWDADDINEGTNAKITYSIEKNVVHERSGEAIFSVHPKSGLITTTVCCLDRETTPEYHIQVVATDGGGLKGTGTVIVRLADVNDNAPRLSKKIWEVEVNETWGAGPPDNATLLEISVSDQDTANYFFYRVVEDSGWGWAHFGVRSARSSGLLYARKTLDFEDDMQRRGFNFMIQVTDRGRGGWVDPHHLDSAWVKVRLRDLNDNPPKFIRQHVLVTVGEDTKPGTVLAALPAHDPDAGGKQTVKYNVLDSWGALTIDGGGIVSLRKPLDRETQDGAVGTARILAMDNGHPPLTSTATLTVTVTDVNDCPPSLLPPTVFHVVEGAPPSLIGVLTATDPDVWALGHGPPFVFSLDPSNQPIIKATVLIKFDPKLDSGRGGAEVWTKSTLDRERHKELFVTVLVKDAGGLADTQVIKVVVDDINDNPMKPGRKMVYMWKTQSGSSDAALGRVYVDDPDDWDLKDKRFRWLGQRHPLFTLNADDGTIIASSQVGEGRYELLFAVEDVYRGQRGISANVTVTVQLLNQQSLAHSTPITLTPVTPEKLTAGWTPQKGGGRLGRLLEAFREILGDALYSVDVLSIYDDTAKETPLHPPSLHAAVSSSSPGNILSSPNPSSASVPARESASSQPSTCVWVSVREGQGGYMNPVKLQGIIGLNSKKLEKVMNLAITSKTPRNVHYQKNASPAKAGGPFLDVDFSSSSSSSSSSPSSLVDPLDPSSAASRASTRPPLQVIDTNSTSIVTPRLTRTTRCHIQEPETCTAASCLNGGRCIGTSHGNRCICPSGAWGYQCKILSRTFDGSGFAWLRPLPPCIPTTISLRVLTRKEEALLLYAGPLVTSNLRGSSSVPRPLLALQVFGGKVEAVVEGGSEALKLKVDRRVNDGNWHLIHVRLDDEGASLMVDLCEGQKPGSLDGNTDCVTRASWRHPKDAELWFNPAPLQLGGLAQTPSISNDQGRRDAIISRHLDGCLSHLVINGQLMDMGEPALSKGSQAGCSLQDSSCTGGCGVRGFCVGGLNKPECHCDPGWSGSECSTPTMPISFGSKSYMKTLVPAASPQSRTLKVQLRIKAHGRVSGMMLKFQSQQSNKTLSLRLKNGIACASASHHKRVLSSVCVEGRPVGDGQWHSIRAECQGYNMIMSIDDGDGQRENSSLPSLLRRQAESEQVLISEESRIPQLPLEANEGDSITLGGIPEFVGVELMNVYDDLNDTCLDDLRISGQLVALSPNLNNTSWGQAANFERVRLGCNAPDHCSNFTCSAPLSCFNNWARPTCSCGQGLHLVGGRCEDIDECAWQPCLNGGTCYNIRPGFLCVCGPTYAGKHCQWTSDSNAVHPLASTAAIAAVTFSLLFLVVVGVVVSLRLRRHYLNRNTSEGEKCSQDSKVSNVSSQEATVIEVKGGTEEGGGGGGGDTTQERKESPPEVILESVKLPHILPSVNDKEKSYTSLAKSRRTSKSSLEAAASILEGRGPITEDILTTKDDLRAYAYEGDGSSAGSLSSALSGLRVEQSEEGSIQPLTPAFLDVMDLLKNLHEAPNKFCASSPGRQKGGTVSATGLKPASIGEKLPESSFQMTVKEKKLSPELLSKTSRSEGDAEEISTVC